MTTEAFKLVSLNVRGISNFRKRRAIFTWCRKRKADFMFLQETHSKKDTEIYWKNEWGAEAVMSHGSSNSCGVAILFRKGVDCVIHTKILDPLGRYIILKAAIKDKMYILINIYAPNKDKDITCFFNNLLITLQNENLDEEENIIVGGDFNCPLNTPVDKKGGIMIPRKSVVASIGCIQSELDLVDIWRVKNPSTKSYTWSQKSPNIFCRLAYWLISNNLHDLVKSVDIIPAIKTDHAAITLDLQTSDNEIKGPGFWKMNCALLEDDDYINDVTSKIPIWLAQGRQDLSDDRIIWDWLKYNIRAHAKQHSKRRARERNGRENRLEEGYAKAKQVFEADPSNTNSNILNGAKENLEAFYDEKLDGVIIRARARWHEHGEKSSKYFLNLEKRNHIKKHMRKLKISGVITTDPFSILAEQKRFYQELYKSRNSNNTDGAQTIESFLHSLNIPVLTEEQKLSCEGAISLE